MVRHARLVNCLNFGNPEHPEVMWQFAEVVDGMSDACRALGIPVVGGNVSFYNESRGRDIDPTPVVGVVGVIDHLDAIPPGPSLVDGARVVVLGTTRPELGGSEWARLHEERGGTPPIADLDAAVALHDLVARARRGTRRRRRARLRRRRARGRDRGDGDRRRVRRDAPVARPGPQLPRSRGSPSPRRRVVLAVEPARVDEVGARATAAGVPWIDLGVAGGDRLVAEGAFDVPVAEAATTWREAIPRLLGREPARAT